MAKTREDREQLVPLVDVMIAVGYDHAPEVVTKRCADEIVPFWDGSPALPISVAERVTAEFRCAHEEARARDAEAEAQRQAEVEEQLAAARRKAAEREGADRRIPWGRDVSTPDHPRWWAESEAE